MIRPNANPIRKVALAFLVCVPLVVGGCKFRTQNPSSELDTSKMSLEDKLHNQVGDNYTGVINTIDLDQLFKACNQRGPYASAILIQNLLDLAILRDLVNDEDAFDSYDPYDQYYLSWLVKSYEKDCFEFLSHELLEGGRMSAKECLEYCDDIINNKVFPLTKNLSDEEIQEYTNAVKEFKARQKNKTSNKQEKNLIAFKIFTIDRIIFWHLFSDYDYNFEYFENNFVKKAEPTP